MPQMICYNVTLRLGRNLRKGKVVLSTCFFFRVSKCRRTMHVRGTLSYLNGDMFKCSFPFICILFYLYDFEDQLFGFISDGFSHKLSEKTVITWIPSSLGDVSMKSTKSVNQLFKLFHSDIVYGFLVQTSLLPKIIFYHHLRVNHLFDMVGRVWWNK